MVSKNLNSPDPVTGTGEALCWRARGIPQEIGEFLLLCGRPADNSPGPISDSPQTNTTLLTGDPATDKEHPGAMEHSASHNGLAYGWEAAVVDEPAEGRARLRAAAR